jgi:type VI secretion system protein ImpA
MSLLDELLKPIPGVNPAGENLRYAPVYDKVKEARRQDDEAPQGDWARERKIADWPLTIKLTTEALSKKSKDLQLAAWLTEAMLRKDGIGGLKDGIELLHGLLEGFWDQLYPEIEDGDAEFRAAPLQWIGDALEHGVKSSPLTRTGLNFYQYRESRLMAYEKEAAEDDTKLTVRTEAIAEGKTTPEAFDDSFNSTPKAWYVQLETSYNATLDKTGALGELCDSRFGDVAPSFGKLRSVLEACKQTVHILLQKKRETEPDPVDTSAAAEPAAADGSGPGAAVARAGAYRAAEPTDREDAVSWLVAAARFIRRNEPQSPAPYLMLRGLRWGELRASGGAVDQLLLDAPPTEIRQKLKRLALQGNWSELLEAAEVAMGKPYGRGWLDIQRYVVRSCTELGPQYVAIAEAVQSELRGLLADIPDLPQMTLMDDAAVASADTLTWLRTIGSMPAVPEPAMDGTAPAVHRPAGGPDVFDVATRAVAAGHHQEGMEMLSRELARERSGRGRFLRKKQMAQLCLSIERAAIALPLLTDIAAEIDARKLEEWEPADEVAHALALYYRCLTALEGSEEEKQRLYERICRLDPAQAMTCIS